MAFKIKYKFKNDENYFTCVLTYEQYKNFQKLPIVKECLVIKDDEENLDAYRQEMQLALNRIVANDTSHMKKLSQIM